MKKYEYRRVLCEALVQSLFTAEDPSVSDGLFTVLKKDHPERENAFVEWALERRELNEVKKEVSLSLVEIEERV